MKYYVKYAIICFVINKHKDKERVKKMKKGKKQQEKIKKNKNYDKGQIFVKVMAGILALLMIVATGSSLIYSLMA